MKRSRNHTSCLVIALCLLVLGGTTLAAQERETAQPGAQLANNGSAGFGSGAAGPIGSGDLLEMSVFDTPELTGKLRVNNNGDVILPLVGTLHVAGMKAEEAQALIRQKLMDGGFVKDPQVTLFVTEYATQNVSVLGEVKMPGAYPAFGSHHLTDYISLAQGLTPLAGNEITITPASQPNQRQRVKISSGSAPQPEDNPEIFPGDTIFVERTGVVYVIGDVARPGGFPMDHDAHLSILQAIALAQGTNPTAAKSSAKIIRTTAQGRQEIPVDLKKVLSAKTSDSLLQDNDILVVPNSAVKSTLRNMELIIPSAATAVIYRVP